MKTPGATISADLVRRLLVLLIPLAVLVTFWPVLHAGFIQWDDDANFLNNPHFRGLHWQNLRWMFTTLYMSNYQPLSWLVSCIGYSLWGMDPAGYHAIGLGFHAINAVLFYLLVSRLLSIAVPASKEDAARPLAAGFAALLFALHPLRVESVAWLSGQHDLQAGAFYLMAILCYLRACLAQGRRRLWLLACIVLFAAAMLSKANGITLPVTLLLLDFYPLRRLPWNPKQWLAPQHRRVWSEKLPLLALAVGFGLVSLMARHPNEVPQSTGLGFRIGQAFYSLAFYLGTTVVPARLTPFYPVPLDLRLQPATLVASAGLVLMLTAMLFHLRRRWPGALVAWAQYVVALLPVLGLVSVTIVLVADRYTYLPCMAWALLAGAAALIGLRRLGTQYRRLLCTALSLVLLLLAGLSWRQSKLWHDSDTLFRYVLALNPNIPEVHNNLGFVLVDQGRIDEGMEEYRKALAIKPDFLKAINNLGLALLGQGRIEEGMEQCQKALDLDPGYAFAHNNLGLALMYLDRPAEALPHFQKAVDLHPEYVMAYGNLGEALLALGHVEEAIAQLRKALALRPDFSAAAALLQIAERQQSP